MDIISLVIILLILVVVIVVVTRPLFKSSAEDELQNAVSDAASSSAEYDEILARIRELDFENKLGKMSVEDYNSLRNELKSKAAALVQPAAPVAEENEKKASSSR